jgi:hypothetical protein
MATLSKTVDHLVNAIAAANDYGATEQALTGRLEHVRLPHDGQRR